MSRIFEEPWILGTLVLAALLRFRAPKLPGIARHVGRSVRILRSEARELRKEASWPADSGAEHSREATESGQGI